MNDRLNTPLGELVAADERRATLFERLALDYCCGGDRTLAEACEDKGLDATTLVAAFEAFDATKATEKPSIDWSQHSLSELIDHIVDTHHAYLRAELPQLASLFERVTEIHAHQSPWLHDAEGVFGTLKLELGAHMQSKEKAIFPLVRAVEAEDASVRLDEAEAQLAQAEVEHDEVGDALRKLRTLSDDYTPPDWACDSFRRLFRRLANLEKDMYRHVHKENSILFPRARRLIEQRAPVYS